MNDKSYMNWVAMSDVALTRIIGEFVNHHRVAQNRSQQEVADAANISRSTLSLLERGESVTLATLIQVLRVLDLLYVMEVFQVKEQISPLLLAKQESNKRTRSRKQSDSNDLED